MGIYNGTRFSSSNPNNQWNEPISYLSRRKIIFQIFQIGGAMLVPERVAKLIIFLDNCLANVANWKNMI